jgi:HAMP domain-containing protein
MIAKAETRPHTARPPNQRRLRNLLIDAHFQLPWVGAIAALTMGLFVVLGATIVWQAHTASAAILDGLNALYSPDDAAIMQEMFTSSDHGVLIGLSVAGATLVLLLAACGLVMTHKVAGPMVALRNSLAAVAAGQYGRARAFRQGDAFQSVSTDMLTMVNALKDRERTELAVLEGLRELTLPAGARSALNDLIAEKRARVE